MNSAATIARALGGEAYGRRILAPGPGHGPRDRSLSVLIDPHAPGGYVVHSHAGDDWRDCRDHVRRAIGLGAWEPHRSAPRQPTRAVVRGDDDAGDRVAAALRIWGAARDPRGTIVEDYLRSRGLALADDIAGDVIRFHARLRCGASYTGGMIALFRDVMNDAPCGIHRTFLDGAANQIGRKMLGRAKGAAIKLDSDASVSLGLFIGEGTETCLAARLAGFRPVWALGSAGAIAAFPVLAAIEAITIMGETDDAGANAQAAQVCAGRWIEAGREVYIVAPHAVGDLNDVWREAAP